MSAVSLSVEVDLGDFDAGALIAELRGRQDGAAIAGDDLAGAFGLSSFETETLALAVRDRDPRRALAVLQGALA